MSSVISVFSSNGLSTLFTSVLLPVIQNEFDAIEIPSIVWKGKTFNSSTQNGSDPQKTLKIDLSLTGGKVDVAMFSLQKVSPNGNGFAIDFTGNVRFQYDTWKENSTTSITHHTFSFAPQSSFTVKDFQFQISPLTIAGKIELALAKGTFDSIVLLLPSFTSVDLNPPARSALINFPEVEAQLLGLLRNNITSAFLAAAKTRLQSSVNSVLKTQLNAFIQSVSLYQNEDIKYNYDNETLGPNLQISSLGQVTFKGTPFPGKIESVQVPTPERDQAIAISSGVFQSVLWAGTSEGLGNAIFTANDLPVPDFLSVDYYATLPDLKPFVDEYKGKQMVVNVKLPDLTCGVDKTNCFKFTAYISLQVTIDGAEVFAASVTQTGPIVASVKQHLRTTFLDMSFQQGKTTVDKANCTVKDLSTNAVTQFISTMWTFALLPAYLNVLGTVGALGVPLPIIPQAKVLLQTWNATGVVIHAANDSDALLNH